MKKRREEFAEFPPCPRSATELRSLVATSGYPEYAHVWCWVEESESPSTMLRMLRRQGALSQECLNSQHPVEGKTLLSYALELMRGSPYPFMEGSPFVELILAGANPHQRNIAGGRCSAAQALHIVAKNLCPEAIDAATACGVDILCADPGLSLVSKSWKCKPELRRLVYSRMHRALLRKSPAERAASVDGLKASVDASHSGLMVRLEASVLSRLVAAPSATAPSRPRM